MNLASKTTTAIKDAILADGGAAFRANLARVMPHIADAYNPEPENPKRKHLGVSTIADECMRKLWYSFHWYPKDGTKGTKGEADDEAQARMYRLWNRGHLEEGRMIALLLTIGCEVFQQEADGRQLRISMYGGHYGSALDAVIVGCPDAPEPILAEFKTHQDKTFKQLLEQGVRQSKYEHYVQMQTYMHVRGLARTLYFAVNKNDDALHAELVDYDGGDTAQRYYERAGHIITEPRAPERMHNASASFWKCKFCDFRSVCYKDRIKVEHNCRTCRYAQPQPDGAWQCASHNMLITDDDQRNGCGSWKART